MINKNRPFFYEKKKISVKKTVLTTIAILVIVIFFLLQIPRIRQVIVTPLYSTGSFLWNGAKDLFQKSKMYPEEEKPVQTYTPLELPDRQVLFAESLENLSAVSREDPLADLRQTPTPSEYSLVAQWQYLDPNLNYAITYGDQPSDEEKQIQIIPPVFEHADLFNDGAAILSANLRYWGIVENQYQIAARIHPDSMDPSISFAEMEEYVSSVYPDYQTIRRLNGDTDILLNILQKNIPVLVFVSDSILLPQWPNDDRIGGTYYMLLGYDGQTNTFSYQDTQNGNTMEISEMDLLSAWYPFQREYMIVYPESSDSDIREALSENYFEELNAQRALSKFEMDSEMLPDNPFAQYNCGVVLHRDGDNGGAWNFFKNAEMLGLPQRYFIYQSDMLQTALELGYADDLEKSADSVLMRNAHDEVLTTYKGWAYILREDIKKGSDYFEKAKKINQNNQTVQYALKYKDTMLN